MVRGCIKKREITNSLAIFYMYILWNGHSGQNVFKWNQEYALGVWAYRYSITLYFVFYPVDYSFDFFLYYRKITWSWLFANLLSPPTPHFLLCFHFFQSMCGVCASSYLAIVAGLASEADFIFIPEDPAPINWQDKLCRKLIQVGIEIGCMSLKRNYIEFGHKSGIAGNKLAAEGFFCFCECMCVRSSTICLNFGFIVHR